jgi:hypothetical protein
MNGVGGIYQASKRLLPFPSLYGEPQLARLWWKMAIVKASQRCYNRFKRVHLSFTRWVEG